VWLGRGCWPVRPSACGRRGLLSTSLVLFHCMYNRMSFPPGVGVVTALKTVRAEQVRRPEWKQNWTVPHCGSVLLICLSLRPVGSIHISCLAAREQTSAAQIAKASPPYRPNMKYFYSFFGIIFQFYFFDWSGPVRVLVPSYRSPRHCPPDWTVLQLLQLNC